jgi:hypothetical protein
MAVSAGCQFARSDNIANHVNPTLGFLIRTPLSTTLVNSCEPLDTTFTGTNPCTRVSLEKSSRPTSIWVVFTTSVCDTWSTTSSRSERLVPSTRLPGSLSR